MTFKRVAKMLHKLTSKVLLSDLDKLTDDELLEIINSTTVLCVRATKIKHQHEVDTAHVNSALRGISG